MRPVLPVGPALFDQAEESFVQGCGLQRVAHPLVPHLMADDTAQLPVNQRHQSVKGVLPAQLQLGQHLGNFPASFRHTRRPFQLFRLLPLIIGNFYPDFQPLACSGQEQRYDTSETGGGDGLEGGDLLRNRAITVQV